MAARKNRESSTVNGSATEPQFRKEQIVVSKTYRNQRDLVDALLEDGKTYTIATVDNLIETYQKGTVK